MTNETLNITSIYNKYHNDILRYIKLKVHSVELAEELTNDTFIKVNNALKTYDGTLSTMNTWLHVIANNAILDYYRSKFNRDLQNEENVSEFTDENGTELFSFVSDSDSAKDLERAELMERIRIAFANLKPKYQRIADLFFIQEMSHIEICEICDLPIGTVKGMISRCKDMLQAQLKNTSIMEGIKVVAE